MKLSWNSFLEREYKDKYLKEKQIFDYITSEHQKIEQKLQFIKHSLFMSAKYGESDLLKKIISHMKEMELSSSTIKEIINFQSDDDGLLSKITLDYIIGNSDTTSSFELLNLGYSMKLTLERQFCKNIMINKDFMKCITKENQRK